MWLRKGSSSGNICCQESKGHISLCHYPRVDADVAAAACDVTHSLSAFINFEIESYIRFFVNNRPITLVYKCLFVSLFVCFLFVCLFVFDRLIIERSYRLAPFASCSQRN